MLSRVGVDDDGAEVTVAPGDTLEVTLPENASTGYRWELSLPPGLAVVADRVEPPSPAHPGAGGQRVFTLRVAAPGVVRAALRRSWEPPERAAQTYTIRVVTPLSGTPG